MALLSAAALSGLAGCAISSTRAQPAADWARDLCPALSAWRAGVSERVPHQLDTRDERYAEAARTGLLLRMSRSHRLTDEAITALRTAGAPELGDQQRIRDRLESGLAGMAAWYEEIERALVEVRTDRPEDYAEDMRRIAMINPRDGMTPARLVAWLRSERALADLFAEVPECGPLSTAI